MPLILDRTLLRVLDGCEIYHTVDLTTPLSLSFSLCKLAIAISAFWGAGLGVSRHRHGCWKKKTS